jgi:uncharacterized protein
VPVRLPIAPAAADVPSRIELLMQPFALLLERYEPATPLCHGLLVHSVLVARRALQIAEEILERLPGARIDLQFLEEAALLHDIGIRECDAPEIHCHGTEPYIRHGLLGRAILEAAGLPRHALVCERHTGSGITREEVLERNLPLEPRDYLPVDIEEKIICVADKFFSKSPTKLWIRKRRKDVVKSLAKHGEGALARWRTLEGEILGRKDDD